MQFINIPKGKGKFRTICVPTKEEKHANQAWIEEAEKILQSTWRDYALNDVPIHGFFKGRSPVTNAMVHRGYRYTLSFDLKDFFDSVQIIHVQGYFAEHGQALLAKECFFSKPPVGILQPVPCAVQGMPASPVLANLAATKMDMMILELVKVGRLGRNFVYTRYCDDLTFSFDSPDLIDHLKREVHRIVAINRFTINESKTKLQCADAGRRIITGVSVDRDIRMTRETRRRIRSARHQIRTRITARNRARIASILREKRQRGDTGSMHGTLIMGYRGLLEWSRLKLPKNYNTGRAPIAQQQKQSVNVAASTSSNRKPSWLLTQSTRSFA